MSVFFFDSSALVKRYANETGSAWVRTVTDPRQPNKIYIAAITGVEVISAIMKKVRTAEVQPADAQRAVGDFRNDFDNQYELFRVSDALIKSAMDLPERHKLRAYDAVQLAAALTLDALSLKQGIPATGVPALVFVSSDSDLLNAARAEALTVDDPALHP
ncbi:MAG TPA: type II toxin-antitoxin system VapC family toxin [Blastocatellia bacterium]|nr:type II toxin-antitoxin system VapC family toxin [Blastocatellia bacterium]